MKAILNIRKRSSLLMHGSEWRSIPLFENSAEACGSSWIQTKLFSISKGKKINIWSDQSLLISLCGRHSLDQSARSLQWCINMNIYCSSGWAGINKQSWPLNGKRQAVQARSQSALNPEAEKRTGETDEKAEQGWTRSCPQVFRG